MSDLPAHPTTGLDDVVHQRVRLGILTVLRESARADFGTLKKLLQLTDGTLSRHLDVLAKEDLVTITKGYEGRRPRTWAQITPRGDHALQVEMAALRQLLEKFDRSVPTSRPEDQ